MKKLTNILLAGSLLLAGCSKGPNPNLLTEKDFKNADWEKIPYNSENNEIWTSYMGEKTPKYTKNWELYQRMTAEKNSFRYAERNSIIYIVGVKGKEISLPDLDGNGYIRFGKLDSVKVVKSTIRIKEGK